MKEFDKEFYDSLGLDPNKIESKTVDMDGKVVVMGKCPVGGCKNYMFAIYDPETGEKTPARCPDFNDPSSRECFWRQYGQLPIGED